MVVRHFHRHAHGRRERRLALARLRRAQPQRAQPERLAKGELALELAGLVRIARDHHRARAPEPQCQAREVLQLVGEARPELRGAQRQAERPGAGVAELHLGDRGEHARGDGRRAVADAVALEQQHREPTLTSAPGHRESDDAAAEHRNVHCRCASRVESHGLD